MTTDEAFQEVGTEISSNPHLTPAALVGFDQCPKEIEELVTDYMPPGLGGGLCIEREDELETAMTHAVCIAFESGRRYGRTQVLEELGMPKVEA